MSPGTMPASRMVNRRGQECEACHGGDSGYVCSKCWRAVKREGICPFCFEQMRPQMDGRRKIWVHTSNGCPAAEGGWGDNLGNGVVDERPRIVKEAASTARQVQAGKPCGRCLGLPPIDGLEHQHVCGKVPA